MRKTLGLSAAIVLAAVLMSPGITQGQGQAQMPAQPMSFFITSVGPGDGANLGGLAGADAYCQKLASAAGAGNRMWRAYLSTAQAGDTPAVNARGRIGTGPWYNAKGQLIAANVNDLHGDIERDRNNVRKPTALNEKGGMVNGVGDMPNQHDMLTGSDSTGRAMIGNAAVTTCNNWTSNGMGNAIVGHHDRLGGGNSSWNAAHSSAGCSQEALVKTGGAGLFYCFAAN
ncbi:MAG: lectin [Acidobacteria bacterium]|nr:lectin [Acidobacteriota bacterium]